MLPVILSSLCTHGSVLGESAKVSAAEDKLHVSYCWTVHTELRIPIRQLPWILVWRRMDREMNTHWAAWSDCVGVVCEIDVWHQRRGRGEPFPHFRFLLKSQTIQMWCSRNRRPQISITGSWWHHVVLNLAPSVIIVQLMIVSAGLSFRRLLNQTSYSLNPC